MRSKADEASRAGGEKQPRREPSREDQDEGYVGIDEQSVSGQLVILLRQQRSVNHAALLAVIVNRKGCSTFVHDTRKQIAKAAQYKSVV